MLSQTLNITNAQEGTSMQSCDLGPLLLFTEAL